jgi:hypothetical protein
MEPFIVRDPPPPPMLSDQAAHLKRKTKVRGRVNFCRLWLVPCLIHCDEAWASPQEVAMNLRWFSMQGSGYWSRTAKKLSSSN